MGEQLTVVGALLLLLTPPLWASLRNITRDALGSEARGRLVAFGDFNADKQTDLFIVRGGNELRIFLADLTSTPYFTPKLRLPLQNEGSSITSVVPGDFNGDSQMDVLLTTVPKDKAGADSPLTVVVYWGENQTLSINKKFLLNVTFSDEPLIMDFNGDMIPDILGVPVGSKTPLIVYGGTLNVTANLNTARQMFVPHSHAFIDLNGDFTAGLLQTEDFTAIIDVLSMKVAEQIMRSLQYAASSVSLLPGDGQTGERKIFHLEYKIA